jgi:hypothetical protein
MRCCTIMCRALIAAILVGAVVLSANVKAGMVDFEDVVLPASGYYNGSDGAGGFSSHGVAFSTSYTDWGGGFTSWENWACSRMTDTVTGDYTNQFSAIVGAGQNNSAQYAVSYPSFSTGISSISLPTAGPIAGAYFTNTTYAYLTMLNGYYGAKKFGGDAGTDEDWFKLKITGKDVAGGSLGSVDFYLADYRDPDPAKDYIVNQWTWVDLSGFGNNVKSLEFGLTSSDVGEFGMNTPGYFAMDGISVSIAPEPNTIVLLAMAVLGLIVWGRRAKS